jgi:hypothetical protein
MIDEICFPYFGNLDFKKNTKNVPKFKINKLNGRKIELDLIFNSNEITDIVINIVPYACSHTVVILIEFKYFDKMYSFSTTTNVVSNLGFWVVEILKTNGSIINEIIPDINKGKKFLYSSLFKESFLLSIKKDILLNNNKSNLSKVKLFLEKL